MAKERYVYASTDAGRGGFRRNLDLAPESSGRGREALLRGFNPRPRAGGDVGPWLAVAIRAVPIRAPEPAPVAAARSAEEKLRAYWTMKGSPPLDRQERLLSKLAEVEKAVLFSQQS